MTTEWMNELITYIDCARWAFEAGYEDLLFSLLRHFDPEVDPLNCWLET